MLYVYGCPVQVSRQSSELATVRLLSSLGWPAAALATAAGQSVLHSSDWRLGRAASLHPPQHGPAPAPAPAVWPPGNQWPVTTCPCPWPRTWSPPDTEPRLPASCCSNKQGGTCGVTKAAVEPDNWESSARVLWRNVAGGPPPRPCLAARPWAAAPAAWWRPPGRARRATGRGRARPTGSAGNSGND